MFHAISSGFSYYVTGWFYSNQAEESYNSQNAFVNPLCDKSRPVEAKVVTRDKLTDYATSDAFLWHLPTRIVGVKQENQTIRYAVFDHSSNNLFQEDLNPSQINVIRDLRVPHLDSTTNKVDFKPFVEHPGRVWSDEKAKVELIKSDNQLVWKVTDIFHKVHFLPLEKGVLLLWDKKDKIVQVELVKSDNQLIWKITDIFHKTDFLPYEEVILSLLNKEAKIELIESDSQHIWKITDLFNQIYFLPLEKGVLLEDYKNPDKAAHPITQKQIDKIERFELQRLTVTKNKIEKLVFIHVRWKSHFNPKLELTPERGAITLINSGSRAGGPILVGHAMLVMEYVAHNRYYLFFGHISKGGTKDCCPRGAKQMVETASMVEQKSAEATQIKKPPKGIPAVIEWRILRNPSQFRYYKKGPTVPASREKLNFIVAAIKKEEEAYLSGNPIVFFDMFHPDRDKANCSKWAYDKLVDAGIEYSSTVLTAYATLLDQIGGGHTYFRKSNWVRYSVVHGHMLDPLGLIKPIVLAVNRLLPLVKDSSRKAITASKEASSQAKESSVASTKRACIKN